MTDVGPTDDVPPGPASGGDVPVPPAGGDRPTSPAGRRGRLPIRGLAVGGLAALVVGVGLAITLALQASGAPACAAPPVGGAVHKGTASYYDAKNSGGNCSLPGPPADRLYVALGASEYAAGAACGSQLEVTGPKGTVRVLVMDQCGGCPPGKLDLSKQAFARIADLSQGIVPVSYRAAVDPPLAGPLTFRMKEGASQWWFALQVGGHGNPLKSVEAMRAGGGWRAAARQDYNYWLIDGGIGPGPYSIRVTDVYGHRVVASGVRMAPEQLQRSTVRMYGTDPAPDAAATTGVPVAPPSPTASPLPPSAPPSAPATGAPGDPVALTAAAAPPAGCGS